MATGTVVRFSGTNGYGFITPDAGGEDVFLHASLLDDDHRDHVPTGTRVEYSAVKGDRGLKAVGVRILSSREPAGSVSGKGDVDDLLCDVVPAAEFEQRITDVLIQFAPSVTGKQITDIRNNLLGYARRHGWLES